MAEVETVPASPRESAGKGSARQARRDGLVPAVIYGNKEEPIMLTLERRVLSKELTNPQFYIQLVDIEIDGAKHRVLPRDVQFHPVSDAPMHVDFLRFDPNRKITAAVPVAFEGESESPGLKGGGVLNVVRYEVEVLCTADNIPPELILHLAGLEVGDSLHASSISLPEGVEFVISDRDFTIATIAAPTVIVEETTEDEEDEEGAEGEEGGEEAGGDDGGDDGGDGQG
ncbi:MAG: 50S ribosomal protein L25/general stress protein Ctc [Pseudomonadota bacterium]|jgi:large subunit ribosomal protein L25|nr:50S ribosomal protein L25/general stress protein Ctc [Rhodospirillaceae bacterium]MEE2720557.1 50S ribosomal protein L25/general stress protein Ctc [Pseudomonadota bacterium]